MSIALLRRAFSIVVIAGLALFALWAALETIEHAREPSGLMAHLRPPEHYEYPTIAVAVWIAMIAVELTFAACMIACARNLLISTGLLAVGFLVLCFPSMIWILDAPRYNGDHLMFVALSTAWLLAATAVLCLARLAVYLLGRRPEPCST